MAGDEATWDSQRDREGSQRQGTDGSQGGSGPGKPPPQPRQGREKWGSIRSLRAEAGSCLAPELQLRLTEALGMPGRAQRLRVWAQGELGWAGDCGSPPHARGACRPSPVLLSVP